MLMCCCFQCLPSLSLRLNNIKLHRADASSKIMIQSQEESELLQEYELLLFKTFVVAMVALRNARVRRYVLLCHFFCFWHFAARTLQFSALPPKSKLLKDVEHNEVPNWIREQMCDLGYDKGVSDNMAEALSFYSPSALVEASRESLLGALQQTFPNDAQRMIMAQSLYDRIQKGITQPQPVSWQRLVSVVARVRCVLFLVDVRQGLCFCGCFAWFQVQSDVPENVKAFARALDDAELEGQILRTETGSFKLQNVSEIWDEKQFYVRGCYTEIADIMWKKKPPVMSLLGSSGIGKSNFMVYLIWRRFQDSEFKDFPVFLHQRDIIHRFQKGEEPKEGGCQDFVGQPLRKLCISWMPTLMWSMGSFASLCGLPLRGGPRQRRSTRNISSMLTTAVGSSLCHHGLWRRCWVKKSWLYTSWRQRLLRNALASLVALPGSCCDWTRQGQASTEERS